MSKMDWAAAAGLDLSELLNKVSQGEHARQVLDICWQLVAAAVTICMMRLCMGNGCSSAFRLCMFMSCIKCIIADVEPGLEDAISTLQYLHDVTVARCTPARPAACTTHMVVLTAFCVLLLSLLRSWYRYMRAWWCLLLSA